MIGGEGEHLLHTLQHAGCLPDGLGLEGHIRLPCLQRTELYLMSALHHQLQQESAHLALLSVGGGIVVEDGDVLGPLQHTVEVVAEDGHLMVYRGQPVGLAYAVGYERRVVDTFGHVALIAGEEQHVAEVQVARLEHAHHLQPFGRFTVEGDRGGLYELRYESLQRGDVYLQVAVVNQRQQAVDERVGPEYRLLEERVLNVRLSCCHLQSFGHPLQQFRVEEHVVERMEEVFRQEPEVRMPAEGLEVSLTEALSLPVVS